MNRYPFIEDIVYQKLSKIYIDTLKSNAYTHLHGCVIIISQLALERGLNVEYARIAAILHDIATYCENCQHRIHAKQSAIMAKSILKQTSLFDDEEITCITTMIERHSHKDVIDDEMCELLKDADMLTTYYTTLTYHDSERLQKLVKLK